MSDLIFPPALRDLPSLRGVNPHKYGLGAWSDHIPFAFDLVAALQPERIVELGTFSGESYFALCQAVLENRVRAVCYAVDTWQGDEHAGVLDESAFRDVTAHNRQFYAPFSYLIRGTFDEAHAQFSDGSIDLLHIDGLHTYEAVKHDFDLWLPKVSERGIVLLHDVSARHGDFGVWKLWEEIATPGRSFLFHHGWGLGVWRKNPKKPLPHRFLERFFAAGPEEAGAIREYYTRAAAALRAHKTGVAADTLPTLQPPVDPDVAADSETAILAQLFFPHPEDNSYAEHCSVCTRYAQGAWRKIVLPLPADYTGAPLRLDPLNCVGLLDVGGIAISSRLFADKPIWACRNRAQLDALQAAGSVEPVPHPRFLRLLSTGDDPHLLLPALTLPDMVNEEPWQLEVWLRVRTDPADFLSSIHPWLEAYRAAPARQTELENLRRTLAAEAAARHEAEAQRTHFAEALGAAHAAHTAAADAHAASSAALESARHELGVAHTELNAARAELEALRATHEKIGPELESDRTALSAARAELESMRAAIKGAYAELENARAGLKAARTERLLTATELSCVREELAQQSTQVAFLEKSRREMAARAHAMSQLEANLKAERAESARVRQQWETSIRARETELQRIREEAAQQAAQIDALAKSLHRLEADYRTELGRRRSMQRSFTWRLGLPLRALSRFLTSGSFRPRKNRLNDSNRRDYGGQ